MQLEFMINDYLLIWNLLFEASISEDIYNLKQKLWNTYQVLYNKAYDDKNNILKDVKNYIPDDDTIYNIVLESDSYKKIRKETEKYQLDISKCWNKKLSRDLHQILHLNIPKYIVYIVPSNLDVLSVTSNEKNKLVILGKKIPENPLTLIINIIYRIVTQEINNYTGKDKIMASAIIDMAINNELLTKVSNNSYYFRGREELADIKRTIYPYWLMYLGVAEKDFSKYMARDKIIFDASKYNYDKKLKSFDINDFINFCIKNEKKIFNDEKLELI